jgi:hypothetical protein
LVSEKWLDASQLATISKIEEQIKPLKSRSLENDKRSLARLEYLQRELGKIEVLYLFIHFFLYIQ